APFGKDVHRSTRDVTIGDGIRVYRYEHVSLGDTSALDPVPEYEKFVAIACQYRPHARLGVETCCQQASDGQYHILLMGAARPGRSRVLPPVTSINGNHYVPIG